MLIDYKGPNVGVVLDAHETETGYIDITLADGYSFEQIKVLYLSNIDEILPYTRVPVGSSVKFPPINSMTPCVLNLHVLDPSKEAACGIAIEKFGHIPNINYFKTKLEPILITGEDGKEYNIIQADQFK